MNERDKNNAEIMPDFDEDYDLLINNNNNKSNNVNVNGNESPESRSTTISNIDDNAFEEVLVDMDLSEIDLLSIGLTRNSFAQILIDLPDYQRLEIQCAIIERELDTKKLKQTLDSFLNKT